MKNKPSPPWPWPRPLDARRSTLAVIFLCEVLAFGVLYGAAPQVTNVRAAQRANTKLVDILYDLTADGPCQIVVQASNDGGTNWDSSAGSFTGAHGTNILPGVDKLIVWNAGADWPFRRSAQMRVRVTACDSVPTNMAFVPAGPFEMGDAWNLGNANELPAHKVYVSAFYMDKYAVTKELWDAVRDYGVANDFQFDNLGMAYGAGHPVHSISWYDAVKWCNARSLKEGLTPVYYTDASQTNIYRTGQSNLLNTFVNWAANGYRLPTEAEWEKAARGGLARHQYPWPSFGPNYNDCIDNTKALYGQSSGGSVPVGGYPPNSLGLYDMAGNMSQWCWDWYDANWYGNAGATVNDTHGPGDPTGNRMVRGGNWNNPAATQRCAFRVVFTPTATNPGTGLRCVRGL